MFSNSNENVTQIIGLNGLNLGLQDIYMDTNTLSSTSIASTVNTPPTTPLTIEPTPPFGSPTNCTTLLQEQQPNLNTVLGAAFNNAIIPDQNTLQNALFMQQQQHLQLLQQQHQLQQQWALANATINNIHQYPDEISHSLKMYAMFSAYKSNCDANRHQLDIMQEFATNGQTSDDLQLHQSRIAATRSHIEANASGTQNLNLLTVAANNSHNQFLQRLQAQTLINLKYPELSYTSGFENHVWRNPSHTPPPIKTVATKTQMLPPFINSKFGIGTTNSFTSRSISTRNLKRHNAKEKFTSSKHCVFCENNNEPEAVTKSHSVRDSLGRVLCPKLRTYVCPICKDSGDMAHTVKYCPKKQIITMEESIRREKQQRDGKTNYYKQQMELNL